MESKKSKGQKKGEGIEEEKVENKMMKEQGHSHEHGHGSHDHSHDHSHAHGMDPELRPGYGSIMEDEEETKHFKTIVAAFFNYKELARIERDMKTLTEKQRTYLKYDPAEKIKKTREAIDKNYAFITDMNGRVQILPQAVHPKEISKMRTTIKQFVRDWSTAGQKEREDCYKPIWDEFVKYFPEPMVDGKRIKVLFPGCGLGRQVFDFAAKGYAAQGNEFSYFMLIASNFILNSVNKKEKYEIQPFIHNFSNNFEYSDPFVTCRIPDVLTSDHITPDSDFSMVAGEFIEVYGKQLESWDSIVTCFFIDTANNILAYIETIYAILKKGGVWINYGPLLYHYAEMPNECSIELSWEELKFAIEKIGFQIKQEDTRKCTYIGEKRTMMQVVYNCVFFTAVKP